MTEFGILLFMFPPHLLVKTMTAAAKASLPVPALEASSTAAQPTHSGTIDLEGSRVRSR